jgi:hypothetical protein
MSHRPAVWTAAVCAGLHLVVLARGGAVMLPMTAPMLTLSALCLLCAIRLRCGDHVEHLMMAFTAPAMVGLHLFVGHDDPLMAAAVGLAAVQTALAVAGLWTGQRNAGRGMPAAGPDDAKSTPTAYEGISLK